MSARRLSGAGTRAGLVIAAAVLLAVGGCTDSGADRSIVIGSKNFTEQVILGELLAQQIEARTTLKAVRKLNLGGTFICHQALMAGQIGAYVEYTGTAATAILHEAPSSDAEIMFATVQQAYRRFNVEWLPPLGFNNTFAVIIRADDARRLGVTTISQLAQYAPKWRAGFGYEFLERADGFPGLARTYGLRFAAEPRVMDLALTYQALAGGQVDVIAGDSTNGLIAGLKLAVLRDDKRYFPSYHAAPVVSAAVLSRFPEVRTALSALAGTLTDEEMRRLNALVDGEKRDVAQVVRDFRQAKNL
jgi:osmoprotectant transport system substrate-binding protein